MEQNFKLGMLGIIKIIKKIRYMSFFYKKTILLINDIGINSTTQLQEVLRSKKFKIPKKIKINGKAFTNQIFDLNSIKHINTNILLIE